MNFKSTLIKLYYLLVHADGVVNEREVAIAKKMNKEEGIAESDFAVAIASLKNQSVASIYSSALEELKKLDHNQQVRIVGWLCVTANADGFMDKNEWKFIYKIYHTELALNLDEVMKVQKELLGIPSKPMLSPVL
ncbi:MAG: TerB family tellurite resistance protein [Bacteroidetes bacterium]|nr:TerB family tellurite resistance protein [Bacteroidota bacterium]